MDDLSDLPDEVREALTDFVASAHEALADHLSAAVLFGSAAEGRLRATSDVNLALVLVAFDTTRIDTLRAALRLAQARIGLAVMLIRLDEIALAREAFAVKFADIAGRHRVLYGSDPFAGLDVPRAALIARVRMELLDLTLRLRNRYAVVSLREEQAARAAADAAGPLRAMAQALLRIEGRPAASPRAALEIVAAEIDPAADTFLARLSRAREQAHLPPGEAGPLLAKLALLAERMGERARRLA